MLNIWYNRIKNKQTKKQTKNEELAAVIVPCGLMKAGFNFANCSIDDGLMPLSFFKGIWIPERTSKIEQC
jgi:hypothetical protein